MRKMFSKNQIKEIVNQAIQSGDISPVLLIQGNFANSNDDEFCIITQINPYKYEEMYHVQVVGIGSLYEIAIDFEESKIYDIDSQEILFNSANIELINILNGETLSVINV